MARPTRRRIVRTVVAAAGLGLTTASSIAQIPGVSWKAVVLAGVGAAMTAIAATSASATPPVTK